MHKSFFHFEGRKIYFEQGMSIAAALMCYGIKDFRQTQVLGKSRGPFCMMGACFDCLLTINGVGNQQGCMRLAEQDIIVKRQDSYSI
tara:strand:+ start:513 stop:773 length:261 start_codon:yes stop_codon:yes gene_type:complete